MNEVKVQRVFSSNCDYTASSRNMQFRWIDPGDSGKVVTPFMLVTTQMTRNFATLGPLELRPPFTRTFLISL